MGWDDTQMSYLLKLLHEYSDPRHRGQNGWTKEGWQAISTAFNLKFPNAGFNKGQIKEQEQQLKKIYRVLKKLSELSGFGWDYTNNCVAALDKVWRPLLEADKDARKWHKRSWPHFSSCQELYEGRFAEGKRASDPEDYRTKSASQSLPSPHHSSAGETSPHPTIPAPGETSQPFDWEQEVEEFGDVNVEPLCTQAPSSEPPPPPPPPPPPQTQSQRFSQMSDNTSTKRRKGGKNAKEDFTDRYIAMKENETRLYIVAMYKSKQSPAEEFSIPRCIEVFNTLEGFTTVDLMNASEWFKTSENRQIFLSLRDDQRAVFLRMRLDNM